jgi:hypothetical protein
MERNEIVKLGKKRTVEKKFRWQSTFKAL